MLPYRKIGLIVGASILSTAVGGAAATAPIIPLFWVATQIGEPADHPMLFVLRVFGPGQDRVQN